MKILKNSLVFLLVAQYASCISQEASQNKTNFLPGKIMVRMAEIKIDANYVAEYMAILREESEASVRLEPGVICIYPMFQKENPTEIRLLEIYADEASYKSHLQTPHFKHYKETTLKMVESLKLIDMEAIDMEAMPGIFKKLN